MLSKKEVMEAQHEQYEECLECARKPKNDLCPDSLVLGNVKMRLYQCDHFIAKGDPPYMRALVCVKCGAPLPENRYFYCYKCFGELKGVKSKRMFRFGG